jgi:uncharacterized protein (TIGR02147 family)
LPELFDYTDYRAFLRDYFAHQKQTNPVFSHQFFARKARIRSSGFMLHVMKGERNLTKAVLLKVAKALDLTPHQTEYFDALVSFNQAAGIDEKNFFFARMAEKRRAVRAGTVEENQYELYSRWYHTVLRELITLVPDNTDAAKLSRLLVPAITPAEVRRSLRLLGALGLIEEHEDGTYRQTDPFIRGGGALRRIALVNFQRAMLEIAAQARNNFPEREIDMSTVTVTMSEELVGLVPFSQSAEALAIDTGGKVYCASRQGQVTIVDRRGERVGLFYPRDGDNSWWSVSDMVVGDDGTIYLLSYDARIMMFRREGTAPE